MRGEIHKQAEQNAGLKKQLAALEAQLHRGQQAPGGAAGGTATSPVSASASGATGAQTAASPKDLAAAANDEGMRLYKEKKYSEAFDKFKHAAELQPAGALYANNAGFACFRLARYAEAADWYQKAVAIDPNRGIAYVNLGDAYLQLGKKPEAKQAFEKFLQLQPNSKSASYVQQKLKTLEQPTQ